MLDIALNLSYTLRMILRHKSRRNGLPRSWGWDLLPIRHDPIQHHLRAAALVLSIVTAVSSNAYAQGAPDSPRTAKASALFDPVGYWVSIVTEDWRFRMVRPPKGDYTGISLNAEGRKIADTWDSAKDEAAGEQCKSYGAPNIMRVPGRLHITWQDDQTLKIETDTGQQTRTLNFGPTTANSSGGWQGLSKASWDLVPAGRGQTPIGSLKVVTTSLRPGYLRKNGVPYSASTVLTEYFDRVTEPSDDSYLVITTTVEDPVYLSQPFVTASHYKKQPTADGWNPAPCSAR
jgi:hypothetical protein